MHEPISERDLGSCLRTMSWVPNRFVRARFASTPSIVQ